MRIRFAPSILALTLLFVPTLASAQMVERAPKRVAPTEGEAGDTTAAPSSELLQQLAFDYSPDGSKMRLKLAKLWLEPLAGKYIPIYFFSNPSLLVPTGKDSATFTAKELISQFGGLLNIAIARPYSFKGSRQGLLGPQGDLRFGAKYVEFPGGADAPHGSVVAQVGGSFQWYARLWNQAEKNVETPRPDTLSQAGTVTLDLRATGNYLGSDKYRALFKDGTNTPPDFLTTWQAGLNLNLFDQVIITAGYMGSTSSLVKGTGFTGITLSRQAPKK